MQQDAHEFLNYLLNTIADILQEERKQEKQNGRVRNGDVDTEDNNSTPDPTWVHEIFQGTLTNETRCLTCETVSPSECLVWKTVWFVTFKFFFENKGVGDELEIGNLSQEMRVPGTC